MQDQKTLQRYVNDFRRHLAPLLRPSIGVSCVVYPARGIGALIEFTIGPEIANEDMFRPVVDTVNDALSMVKQNAFGGELKGFIFRGTNVIGEGNRVILLKGEDAPEFWDDKAALEDVKRIFMRPAVLRKTA